MSDKYSSEFKSKVAKEAASSGHEAVKDIAAKYDVTEEEVIEWVSEYTEEAIVVNSSESSSTYDEGSSEDVDISTDDEEFADAVDLGVMSDHLNYKKLIFWSTLGASLVIIFVIGMVYFSQFSLFEAQKTASERVTYSDFSELFSEQNEELNSFGVVDLEKGIYRIPIDSAINKIAID